MIDNSYIQNELKELSPGIWLHREKKNNESFIWKIEVKIMSIVDVVIDFSGSEGVYGINDSNSNSNNSTNNQMIFNFQIKPLEIKEIAKSISFHKVNFKADFKLTVPPKQLQKQLLQPEITTQQHLLNKCKHLFINNHFEFLTQTTIESILTKNSILKYIDFEFPPNEHSFSGNKEEDSELEYLIHWKRPEDFILLSHTPSHSLSKPNINLINNDEPEPNDVHQDYINDYGLASALSAIAEKHNMVLRLFGSRNTSQHGIYVVTLWLHGRTRNVVVDDLFPCIPMGNPIVTRSTSNEIWVLLIEKAVAKLVGNYYRIKMLTLAESLLMVTGCPTFCYLINHEDNNEEYKNTLMRQIEMYVKYKYIVLAVNTRFIDENEYENDNNSNNSNVGFTIPGLGYSVIDVIHAGKYNFIKLRKVWHDQNEQSINDNIAMYYDKYKSILMEYEYEYGINEDKIYLLMEDFFKEFNELDICYTKSWDEIRLSGEFIIPNETYNNNNNIHNNKSNINEQCISKWYYCLTLNTSGTIIISLFQNEDKIKESDSRKPIIDISLSILNYNTITNEIYHIQTLDFVHSSNLQMELTLKAGTYIILPRSSGFFLGKPLYSQTETSYTPLYDSITKTITPIFTEVIKDIFKRYDTNLTNTLTYNDFASLYFNCTKTQIKESEFVSLLNSYSNYNSGLTERGFVQYMTNAYETKGEDVIRKWLFNLGYTNNLYCNISRCFILTIHSTISISINTKETLGCEIHSLVNKILLKNFGNKYSNKKQGVIIPIMFSSKLNGVITFGCENKSNSDMLVQIKIEDNENDIIHNAKKPIEKIIKGNDCEFFCYVFNYAVDEFDSFDFTITSKQI